MHTLHLVWEDLWKIFVAGLILGAGLPALFAVGVRSMAYGTGGDAEQHADGVLPAPHPAGQAVAFLCFAVVLLVVIGGIVLIVATGAGKEVDFSHVWPSIHDK